MKAHIFLNDLQAIVLCFLFHSIFRGVFPNKKINNGPLQSDTSKVRSLHSFLRTCLCVQTHFDLIINIFVIMIYDNNINPQKINVLKYKLT